MNDRIRANTIVEKIGSYGGAQFPEDEKEDQIEMLLKFASDVRKDAIETFKAGMKPLMLKHATDVAGLIIENKKLKAERDQLLQHR